MKRILVNSSITNISYCKRQIPHLETSDQKNRKKELRPAKF